MDLKNLPDIIGACLMLTQKEYQCHQDKVLPFYTLEPKNTCADRIMWSPF